MSERTPDQELDDDLEHRKWKNAQASVFYSKALKEAEFEVKRLSQCVTATKYVNSVLSSMQACMPWVMESETYYIVKKNEFCFAIDRDLQSNCYINHTAQWLEELKHRSPNAHTFLTDEFKVGVSYFLTDERFMWEILNMVTFPTLVDGVPVLPILTQKIIGRDLKKVDFIPMAFPHE